MLATARRLALGASKIRANAATSTSTARFSASDHGDDARNMRPMPEGTTPIVEEHMKTPDDALSSTPRATDARARTSTERTGSTTTERLARSRVVRLARARVDVRTTGTNDHGIDMVHPHRGAQCRVMTRECLTIRESRVERVGRAPTNGPMHRKTASTPRG